MLLDHAAPSCFSVALFGRGVPSCSSVTLPIALPALCASLSRSIVLGHAQSRSIVFYRSRALLCHPLYCSSVALHPVPWLYAILFVVGRIVPLPGRALSCSIMRL